ncbi:hypothetical protein IIA79_05415 [bacterium]|nr:hypothetical protein [bacterium]
MMAKIFNWPTLVKGLKRKSFSVEEGSSHTKMFLQINGVDYGIFTVASRNNSDIGLEMRSKIARQLRMPGGGFLADYIECMKTLDDYIVELHKKGIVEHAKLPFDKDNH